MTITQHTIVDQIEIRRDGTVQIRLAKQLVRDGKVLSSGWHRAAWEPGADFDAGCEAVNSHLAAMGEAPVDATEWGRCRRVIEMEHTADVVEAYQGKKADEVAAFTATAAK